MLDESKMISDGKIHRMNDGHKGKSLWYVKYETWGTWGNWRTGEKHVFRSGKDVDFDTARTLRAKANRDKNIEEKKVSVQCFKQWNSLPAATSTHPYLWKKKVHSFGLKMSSYNLFVPLHDISGTLWSMQMITPKGDKFFVKGGRKKACFFKIGDGNKGIIICEGYSTAATLHMALPEYTIVIAFDAGNILPVVGKFKNYPNDMPIIIAADNDCYGDINAGLESAKKVFDQYKIPYIIPEFKDITTKPTDYNDLYILEGLEAVRNQVLRQICHG
jgi:putative DNA primase/helicase